MKGSVFIAVTLDGYIATPDGNVDFLNDFMAEETSPAEKDPYSFESFLQKVDVMIMGRKTFEKVLSFGDAMWAYGSLPIIVWTRQDDYAIPENRQGTVRCRNLSPLGLWDDLQNQGYQHAYIDGGATIAAFHACALIDDWILTRVPILLGDGVSLFAPTVPGYEPLTHVHTQSSERNGFVTSHYRAAARDVVEPSLPADDDDGDAAILHDNPDYIPPNQQDILLTDVTSKKLHTVISGELEIMYLSPAEETQSSPLLGFVFGFNKRLLVNVVTRRRSRRVGGPKYPSFNVVFLCDTVSPSTFICAEAMTVLLGKQNQDAIPETLTVQLADFPFAVEAHVSPFASHYSDVNVIGMDVLTKLKTTIHGKSLSFTLAPDHEYEVE
jgi:dihydrofolate reductase